MHIKRHALAVLIIGGGLWGAVVTPCSATGAFQRDTLRGLPGVWVAVEHLPPELEQAGVTQGHLQRDAEEKLRQAGLRVLTEEECWRTPGMPWLYVTVALLKAEDTTYAATIAAALHQEVRLTRDPQVKTFGATWDAGVHVGAVAAERLPTIRESMGRLVDQFVADYQAVNGRAGP